MIHFISHLLHIFLFFILLIHQTGIHAQTLQATMKYLFIDGESVGEYTGGVHINAGTIKVGDVLKPKDEDGKEFTFVIKSIEDYDLNENVQSIGPGKDALLVMETKDKKKLAKNPTGSLFFGSNTTVKKEASKSDVGTGCTLDGREWKGVNYYKSSSYFPKGNSLVNTTQPYLILSFKAGLHPDDRQLTFIHKEAKVGVGKLDTKNYEFVLSGSHEGIPEKSCMVSNWKDGVANTQKTDFYFEITQFEDKGDHIIISAKYSGIIYGLNLFKGLIGTSCKDVIIKSGEIKSLKVGKY